MRHSRSPGNTHNLAIECHSIPLEVDETGIADDASVDLRDILDGKLVCAGQGNVEDRVDNIRECLLVLAHVVAESSCDALANQMPEDVVVELSVLLVNVLFAIVHEDAILS